MSQGNRRGRYLDVSEYMLKEYSPMNRAMTAQNRLNERSYHERYPTPEIAPIDHDPSNIKITPFLNGLIELAQDNIDDFLLDDGISYEHRTKDRHRGEWVRTRHRSNSLILFHVQNQLEDIMEESDYEFNSLEESYSSRYDEEEDQEEELSDRYDEKPVELDQLQMQTEREYRQKIEKYVKQPKLTLLKEIKKIAETKDEPNQTVKLQGIKKVIQTYIVDFQMPCFEEAWNQLDFPLAKKLATITRGIEENFNKQIGNLSFECRRMKLLKYLQKKRMRKWRKKVSYDCRKKVADSRLRIKGKFVTREQVCSQLGISDLHRYTGDELRELLEKKLEGRDSESC